MHLRFSCTIWSYAQGLFSSSKEHITGPLGMESSFYLTPELKRRLVNLTFRDSDGGLNPWANQVNIIEQDPSKGGPILSCHNFIFILCFAYRLVCLSSPSFGWCRHVQLHEGLSQDSASLDAD